MFDAKSKKNPKLGNSEKIKNIKTSNFYFSKNWRYKRQTCKTSTDK